MTVYAFLHRIKFLTAERPDDVSEARWRGMLAWYLTRLRCRENVWEE